MTQKREKPQQQQQAEAQQDPAHEQTPPATIDADTMLARAGKRLALLAELRAALVADIERNEESVRSQESEMARQAEVISLARDQRDDLEAQIRRTRVTLQLMEGTPAAESTRQRLDELERQHQALDEEIRSSEGDLVERQAGVVVTTTQLRGIVAALLAKVAELDQERADVEAERSKAHAQKIETVRRLCLELVELREQQAAEQQAATDRAKFVAAQTREQMVAELRQYPELRQEAQRLAPPAAESPKSLILAAFEQLLTTVAGLAGQVSPDEPIEMIPGRVLARSEVLADFLAVSSGDIRQLLRLEPSDLLNSSPWATTEAQRFARSRLDAIAALRLRWRVQRAGQLPLGTVGGGSWFDPNSAA